MTKTGVCPACIVVIVGERNGMVSLGGSNLAPNPGHNPLLAMAQSKTALKTFSLTNDIIEVSPQDQIYRYDAAADRLINNQSPWSSEYVSVYDEATLITVP
jgi:hypothetical protein